MPRAIRNARLETRTQRRNLDREVYHWFRLSDGVALGYRRGKADYGTWTVRVLVDKLRGRYATDRIGLADDRDSADGREVLTFDQAAKLARERATADRTKDTPSLHVPLTVAQAVVRYLEWFRVHRKSYKATEITLKAHVLPTFGRLPVAQLRTRDIQRWHEQLATSPARARSPRADSRNSKTRAAEELAQHFRHQDLEDADTLRARKSTANRVLTVFRAALNHAWREGLVPNDAEAEWRRVKPFRNVDAPRVRYLEEAQAQRLINAAAPDLRKLVTAALLTGCRLGELVELQVDDFRADAGSIHVRDSKSGKPRHVPLNDEGLAFFTELTAGRSAGETMLLRADGVPWLQNYHVRPLIEACSAAKIDPPASFHVLRHTYASWLAMKGVALQVIAEALGHADTRITQRHYGHLAPSYVAQVIRANLPSMNLAFGNVRPLKRRAKSKAKTAVPA